MTKKKCAKAKTLTEKDKKIQELETGLINNGKAMGEKRKKKNWTLHDLNPLKPINNPQKIMFESYFSGNNIIANGSAGSGKTIAAIYLALNDILSKERTQNRLIIVRSAVATRDLGHLPGDIDEKLQPYENPYRDIFKFLLGRCNSYDDMKSAGIVEFMSTSFIRGLNWDDSIIIVDEIQNMNFPEIYSVMTRVGDESRIIVIGDYLQSDLNQSNRDTTGIKTFLKIAKHMSNFKEIMFKKEDVIRSGFVKDWIHASEDVLGF